MFAVTWRRILQDLHEPSERVSYGDADVMPIILTRLGGGADARLIITDDEQQPWLVLTGTVRDLLTLVAEQRFFEYMLAADDSSWLVFDTHHNELIFVGSSPEPGVDEPASVKRPG